MIILKHNAGENFLYLKAIRHEKLNRPDKPCEPSPEYKLASCLEKSVVARAGCQPPWKRFTVDGQPTCDNVSLLNQFGEEYTTFYNMERHQLYEETNCLMPCIFIRHPNHTCSDHNHYLHLPIAYLRPLSIIVL